MRIRQFSEQMRHLVELGGGGVIAFVIVLLFLAGSFERLELQMYDWRFLVRGEREPLPEILIVTIDEISEEKLQQRIPWKRSLHAEFIRTLLKHQPKLIVYDVIFQSPTDPAEDEAFANALYDAYNEERGMGIVVLSQYISQRIEKPLTMLADNAGGVGVINLYPDHDNIVRSVPTFAREVLADGTAKDRLSLGLETAALYRGGVNSLTFPRPGTMLLSRTEQGTSAEVLRVTAPNNTLLINYIGGRYVYPMISFWKILHGEYDPKDLEGKVIFVADTSLTSHDYFLTPFQKPARKYVQQLQQETLAGAKLTNVSTFGVEVHAQAFQTIIQQAYIHKLARPWSVLLILCLGALAGIMFFKDRGFTLNALLIVLSIGVAWGVSQLLFNTANLWIDLAPLESVIVVNYIAGLAFQRVIAMYNRNQVKGAFEQYVSAVVVDEMLKHPEKMHLGGERKDLSVLFSDIRGFTTISERMESQELVKFLNEYLTAMTDMVMRYDGTLDKYMGDAIMAIYGAPIEQPDHAFRACSSALDMMAKLHELQPIWQAQGRPLMNIGIGVNSGMMTAGNMGSEKRFDFTVMGDNVNLGSRLEGLNKEYGTNIIISEYTYREVKDQLVVRELDLVRVKGKYEPVRIYELIGRIGEVPPATLTFIEHFERGLTLYRQQAWGQAIAQFHDVLNLSADDKPSRLYIQRSEAYQLESPADNWDGVYTMKTK